MIIKPAENKDRDIAALEQIAAREGASEALKAKVAYQIKIIQAGQKGEREAAYEIDFYLRDSKDYAVLHDLRVEHGGRVAQIDHLVIDRDLRFWVLESKHFAEGVAVKAHRQMPARRFQLVGFTQDGAGAICDAPAAIFKLHRE